MSSSSAENLEICFPRSVCAVLPFPGPSNRSGPRGPPPSPNHVPRLSVLHSADSKASMRNDNSDTKIVENDETRYMDRALESWCWWANGVGPQAPVSFGDLLNISSDDPGSGLLELTDDQFVLIDQTVARLADYYKHLIDVEYRWGGTQEQKAKHFELNRDRYRERVVEMLALVYQNLMPEIEAWRESVL